MLVTITYTGEKNTADLGYLLYKKPDHPQVFELSYGRAYVFYPDVNQTVWEKPTISSPHGRSTGFTRTTVALLLDIDPIGLVRRTGKAGLFDYVNDRPYVSSSFMSTAISKVFGTAMTGRANGYQALSDSPLDLTATITMLPCRGDLDKLDSVFGPLGYEGSYETFDTDETFPDWGRSDYVNLTIHGKVRLRDLLRHLYVLIPVFDAQKHYWVGEAEVDKLLRAGGDWLAGHPEKDFITERYLRRYRSLVSLAYERLAQANAVDGEVIATTDEPPRNPTLNSRRLGQVVAELHRCGARRVIDLGCGEGNLLKLLVSDQQFTQLTGTDVSLAVLKRAAAKLHWDDQASESYRQRLNLFQGSLVYRDDRFAGYDAACVVEVIEHLDPARLATFERVLFEFAKPTTVILTTPNHEYNVNYPLGIEGMRHSDHRFEWTRQEFQHWAGQVAHRFGYTVEFTPIGDVDPVHGAPTQMGVFTR